MGEERHAYVSDGSFDVVPGGYRLPGISPTLDIQQAITAPRIAFMDPDSLAINPEPGPLGLREALESRGRGRILM